MATLPTKVIVNPKAGRGAALRYARKLQSAVSSRDPEFTFHFTEGSGHATELARSVVKEGGQRVVAMGGDGTISEVTNGLVGSGVAVGIIPVGTGNDIARSVGLPTRRPDHALEVIRRGNIRRMDVGKTGERFFVSLLGVGFACRVAGVANTVRFPRGAAVFPVALLRVLGSLETVPVRIRLDGKDLHLDCVSVMVQNTPSTGGGLRIAPNARIDDGWLDVVIVKDIGKAGLLWNLPKVYRGRHLNHPAFSVFRAKRITLDSPESLDVVVDGDLLGATPFEVEVVPLGVRVIAG